MQPTYDELRRCLFALDEPAVKRLVRGVLHKPYEPEAVVPMMQQLQVLLADWLAHLGFLTDAQQHSAISELTRSFEFFSAILEKCHIADDNKPKPKLTLVVCDCRWISCAYRDGFFDLQECLNVEQLPEVAVTHIACDVTALYRKFLRRLTQVRKSGKDAAHEYHSAGGGVPSGLPHD